MMQKQIDFNKLLVYNIIKLDSILSSHQYKNKDINLCIDSCILALIRGANPSICNNLPIKFASKYGLLQLVSFLLYNKKVDPSINDNRALIKATERGHTEVVRLLLSDIRVNPEVNENRAIRIAIKNHDIKTLHLFLADKRVNPSYPNNRALILAIIYDNVEAFRLLLASGKINPEFNSRKIFLKACGCTYIFNSKERQEKPKILNLWLSYKGVNPAANDNELIRITAKYGKLKSVKILLNSGRVNPTARKHKAIIAAAKNGHEEIVSVLYNYYLKNNIELPSDPDLNKIIVKNMIKHQNFEPIFRGMQNDKDISVFKKQQFNSLLNRVPTEIFNLIESYNREHATEESSTTGYTENKINFL